MYTYDLIINEEKRNVNFTYEKQAKDIKKMIKGKRVLFTKNNCEKCDELATVLKDNRISHRVFDITEDAILYNQFMRLIERSLTEETKIRFPVIWNKDHVIFGYNDLGNDSKRDSIIKTPCCCPNLPDNPPHA